MKLSRTHKTNPKIGKLLRQMLPAVTLSDFQAIEEIAQRGHLRHLPEGIIAWQAITAHVRHAHTDYDELLAEGYDVESARHFVLDAINSKLEEWGCTRRIEEGDSET